MRGTTPRLSRTASGWVAAAVLLAAASCGKSGPKPADADVAAYLARSQPAYLRLGQLHTSYEPATDLGTTKLPMGSWRVHVRFVLHAEQDLFAPVPDARTRRAAFDRAVSEAELYRLSRIAAVERLGKQAGLVTEGATVPEPAVPVGLATHTGQDLPDQVTLLAQPDGSGWKFFQLNAQTLSDDAIGAPLDELRRESPKTRFVVEGSPEAREAALREQQFLAVLAKAGKP